MYHQAYLVAIYWLGKNYHSGLWSRGYKLMCLALVRGEREHSAWNVMRTCEQLEEHKLYPKGCNFRNAVAFWLKKMRHSRYKL